MYPSIHLSIHIPICLFIYNLFVYYYPSVQPSNPSIHRIYYLSIIYLLSLIYPCLYPSVHPSIISPPICPSIHHLPAHLSIHPSSSPRPSGHSSIPLSIDLFIHLPIHMYPSIIYPSRSFYRLGTRDPNMRDLVCGQSSQSVSLVSAPLRGRPVSWWVSEDMCDDGNVDGNETACLSHQVQLLPSLLLG